MTVQPNQSPPPPGDSGKPPPQSGDAALSDREHYFKLAEFAEKSFTNRQTYEWRLNFSFWTAIGLTVLAVVKHEINLVPEWHPKLLIVLFAGSLAALYVYFQFFVNEKNHKDILRKIYYLELAEHPNTVNEPKMVCKRRKWEVKPKSGEIWRKEWIRLCVLFTLGLLTVAVLVMWDSVGKQPTDEGSSKLPVASPTMRNVPQDSDRTTSP